jgi:hypothetical protein
VLITNSNSRVVFEIARAGEAVWEFRNPDVDAETNQRGAIYRMIWLDPARQPCLEAALR